MGQYKSLLKRYDVEVAERKRTCKHNRTHSIYQGESCLVVREGQTGRYVYCMPCAREMFKKASEDILIEIAQFD